MIRRLFTLASLGALFAAVALPPAPATAYEPHVLSYSDELDVSSLNPFFATSGNITALDELTAAEFTRFDDKGNPIPELITVIPTQANGGISHDGKTITFHLRHGVKWSDGVPFDASDVMYTIAVAKNEQNNLIVHDPWERLTSASAPDKFTVVLHIKDPYSPFLQDYFSTISNSAILPKHVLGPGTLINDAPYNGLPVGIGPFRYAAYNRGDSVVMEANPNYWRGRPKLNRVIYKIITDQNTLMTQLTTGELDLWDLINGTFAGRAKALPDKASATRLSNYISGIYFNTKHPQLADPAVRRALRAATNREAIFDKVVLRNGAITESVIPQVTRNYLNLPLTKYDPAAAAKMLDAAGWKMGPDGVRHKGALTLTVDIAIPSGYAPSATLAELLHSDWGKVGVGVTIHTWSTPQFFATYSAGGILQTGKFDAALFSQGVGPVYASINGLYDCAGAPPHGQNVMHYCNRQVDTLSDRYLHTYDPAEQAASAAGFQRLIEGDAPTIVLYERAFLAVHDNHVTGYHPHPFSYWGDPMQLDN
jgi:peptide/nickel transport system substrate-binding protein